MQHLVTCGQLYAAAVFAESKHVDATALVETDEDLITLTVPSESCGDDDDDDSTRASFRQAVEQVVSQSKVQSVTVLAEVWFNVESRFSSEARPPLRNLRREALVVHVETPGQFSVTLAEITRWDDDAVLGPWREVSSIYLPGLTGFLPKISDVYVH